MKTRFLTFYFLLLSIVFYGQSANTSSSSQKMIKSNFSYQAIKVYQESAVYKVKDYYHYLELYSSSKVSDSLKIQIKLAIYNLFLTKNIEVIDITASEKFCIKLDKLLDKITNKNYSFKITNIENSIVAQDFWTTKYYLQVIDDEEICNLEVFSRVVFKPIQKKFGTKTKEVWSLFLGEME